MSKGLLDKLSLQYNVRADRKCLVDLTRNEKLDALAVIYYESFSNPSLSTRGRTNNPNSRTGRTSRTTGLNHHRSGKLASNRKRPTLAIRSQHDCNRSEETSKISCQRDVKSASWAIAFNNACHNGSTENSLPKESITPTSRNACGRGTSAKTTTMNHKSRLTLENPSNQHGSQSAAVSDRPTSTSSMSQEDFMALLLLSPAHVTERARKCTRHQISKHLLAKSQVLWRKICDDNNINPRLLPENETLRRPYVLLNRSRVIDDLARQKNPPSIKLKSYKVGAAYYRKMFFRSSGKKLLTLNVKLKKETYLDHLALQSSDSIHISNSSNPSETNVVSPWITKITNADSSSTPISHASAETEWKKAIVKICRNAGLDMLALQSANLTTRAPSPNSARIKVVSPCEDKLTAAVSETLSDDVEQPGFKKLLIMVNRDSSINQLALQSIDTSVTDCCSACTNPTVSSHLKLRHDSTPMLPLDSSPSIPSYSKLNAVDKSHRPRRTKLGLLDVIKLKRVSCSNWSVIQPDAQSSEAKSFPNVEETLPDVHQNENKNPQNHSIPHGNISFGNPSSTAGVVKPLVLRRSPEILFGRTPSDERPTRHKNCRIIEQPAIFHYMPVKKPLGQLSPNSPCM